MTSMAAALAASLPAPAAARPTQSISAAPKSTQVPQRMEGVVDVEAAREVESVQLNSLVVLKILKHSTDTLPPPNPQTSFQADRNPPPYTELGSHPDALGVLLGLDLDGVLEVEDSFALPAGETSLGANSYSAKLLQHLREVQTPDSQVGIYLSTHNGGFATRVAIELLAAVEKVTGRGKAILVVHDISRSIGGDLSIKAYRMSEGAREATRRGKWDSLTLNENKVTAATLLSTLPVTVSSPSLLNALLSALTTPAESSSSKSFSSTLESNVILPPTFAPLQNPTDTSLPAYLSSTLDSLLLHNHETNNVAFLQRQIAREKTKHDSLVREREEENVRRKKAGMGELPLIGEFKGAAKDPNRLELVCLTGQVDSLAKNMGAEAAKGLVRAYL